MSDALVFVDRLPPDMAPTRQRRTAGAARQLRNAPRTWALIRDDYPRRRAAQEASYRIRDGRAAVWGPPGAFEARAITSEAGVHQVWARYIGGAA